MGTDNHLMLVDLTSKGITGKTAERALEEAGITVNKNMVPFDTKSPFVTSGIRIGTPALTTRGMKEEEMKRIGDFIHRVLTNPDDEKMISRVRKEVVELSQNFLIYQDLL
jgi:glycine hydroxymethyltransferase